MMTKRDLEERAKSMQAELDKLNAEIKAMPGETGVWRPRYDDDYYFICDSKRPNVDRLPWTEDEDDGYRLSIGNVFRTKQEAEDRIFKLKIEQRLRELAGGFRPDGQNYYVIYADCQRIGIVHMWNKYGSVVPFKSAHEAQSAIDAIGQADLKRYFEIPA